MSFIAAPLQSEALQNENLPPPNAILNADLNNPHTLRIKKRAAVAYFDGVMGKRQRTDNATRADVEEAERHLFGSKIAEIMPQISAQAVPVNLQPLQQLILQLQQQMQQQMQQIQQQIQQIQQQIQQIQQQNDNVNARLYNASAAFHSDTLTPPPYGGQLVPGNFPTTFSGILALSAAELTVVENYYGLGHAGTLQ
eukprot:gene28121-33956_t